MRPRHPVGNESAGKAEQAAPGTAGRSDRDRTARGLLPSVGFSAVAQAAPLLTNLVLTPYLIRHLGLDRFGVWSLVLVFLATLTVLDGGVGASLARFHAYHAARGDREGAGRLVTGALVLFVALGVVVTGLCLLLAPMLTSAVDVPPQLREEAGLLLLALGPLLTLALASNSATALLQANARFRTLAGVSGGSCLAYAVAVVVLIDQERICPCSPSSRPAGICS